MVVLAARLQSLARMQGYQANDITESWQARPCVSHGYCLCGQMTNHSLQTNVIQKNGYDCGLWVLVGIAAVLRGYDVTDFLDEDMTWF